MAKHLDYWYLVNTTLFVMNSTNFSAFRSGTAAISTYLDRSSVATMMCCAFDRLSLGCNFHSFWR
jgi:hypothetical protein